MAKLNIRVGASVDRSLTVAFQPMLDAAKRARGAIDTEMKRTSRSVSTETKKGTDSAEAAFRDLENEIRSGMPKAMDASTAAIRKFGNDAKTSLSATKRSFDELARDSEAAMKRIERSQRTGGSLAGRAYNAAGGTDGVKSGLSRAGRLAMGVGRAGAHAAYELGMSYAHGIGVDTDISGIFHKNTELESGATALSNAGVIKEDPRNAQRVDPRELMRQVLDTSSKTGSDANTTLEGLRKFVDLTGDLATGRELIGDMEMLAKATGTSMEDMISAAGEISLALGPVENKAGSIKVLMNQFAAQGERGANAIRLLAPQMAKIASSAVQFEGDKVKNMALLGALGQEARMGGGAATTTQSATSIAAFVNTLKTPARANAFKAATGMDVFNKDTGMLRNPEEIIIAALRSKGMDPLGFKDIFKGVQGARAPEALANIYRQNGGGDAGEAAVRKELDRMKQAYIDQEQVMASFNAAMSTSESQANVFNNTIREVALRMNDNLLPAALALAPALTAMAVSAANFIAWVLGDDAAVKIRGDKSNTAVDHAVGDTQKQIDQGIIIDGQRKLNDRAEDEAWQARVAAGGGEYKGTKIEGQLEKAEGERTSDGMRSFLRAISFGSPAVERRFAAQDQNVDEKKEAAAKSEAQWEKIHAQNQRVADLLANNVIQVRVVAPVPVAPGAPSLSGAGRQDSVDEKADQR